MIVSKENYLNLQHRIEELENILCPCGSHDWVEIDAYNGYEVWTCKPRGGRRYQCKKCLKKKFVPFEDNYETDGER